MKSLLWGIFEKPQTLARGVFETSQKRHRKNIFFEILLRHLKDVIKNSSLLRHFQEASNMSLSMEI